VSYWYDHEQVTADELATLAEAWVRHATLQRDVDFWAAEAAIDAAATPSLSPIAWRLLLALSDSVDPTDDMSIGLIGASPLEIFIDTNGTEAMDLLEPAAKANPVLLQALGSVSSHDPVVGPRLARFLVSQDVDSA
jgi:hypothetical protein